jgi:hypothetical protein
MSKLKLSLLLLIMSAVSFPAMAGEKVVKRVPAGAVAFHFVADLSYMTGELVGYIAFIEGVDGPLFAEPTDSAIPRYSKDMAYFTVRITTPTPFPIPLPVETGSEISVSLLEPAGAQATVYYNANPGSRDWNDPATFAQGVPIAVLEESALLSTRSGGASFNVFSSRLVDSSPIWFNGQKIDFKKLVPNGVTITNYTSPRFMLVGDVVIPVGASFGATAFAIGGDLRDKSKHRD